MNLRIWVPCILLLVIFVLSIKTYFLEGFQSGGSGSLYPSLSKNDTRIEFWKMIAQDKGGGSGSGSSSFSSLLSKVMNPQPNDVFKLVYPKYISIYALAKYKNNPVAARYALINMFDTVQSELTTQVEQETAQRTAFNANPQLESCTTLSNLTLGLYGQLISVYAKSKEFSQLEATEENLHTENISLQNSVLGACSNQGATPSAACIKLATQHEKLFPTLPIYTTANKTFLDNGISIQNAINTLLQAYSGMGCSLPQGSGSISIPAVFSSEYLNSLETIDTVALTSVLQELSPYYVSPTITKYVAGQITGVTDLNSNLSTTVDYVADMKRAANNILSLNTMAGTGLGGGQFYDQASGGVATCPPGYYCTDAATMPTRCPVGTYCPAGVSRPVPCTNGQFSPEGAKSAAECGPSAPPGYYLDSTNKAVRCPTGSYCSGGVRTPCPNGTYNMKQGMGAPTACLPCPAGGYCPSPTKIVPCDPGTYSLSTGNTASACSPCPAGTYCPAKGTATPIPCGPGTFSVGATTSGSKTVGPIQCIPAAPGYYLPGTGNTSGPGIPCPAGGYCPGGSGAPLDCPVGSYCLSTSGGGGSGVTIPILCPAGTYGATVNLTTAACSGPCLAGYICPAGSKIDSVTKCPAGYYCPTGSAAGRICSAGGYCPIGVSTPIPCPINTYNPTESTQSVSVTTACQPCPQGRICNTPTGTVTPGTCPRGSYCGYGVDPALCYPGTYCPTEGLTSPVPCPAGTYCDTDGLIQPKNCPTGTYSSTPGQTSSSTCIACPPGTYCPAGGSGSSTTGAGSPLPCPPGTICPGSGMSSPQQCPIGNICPIPGLSSGSPCPPGRVCNTAGEINPSGSCPAGTYSLGGVGSTGNCIPCPSGTYGLGGDTTAACSGQCPRGYYCPPNTTSPTANVCATGYLCPPGTDLTEFINFLSSTLSATATGTRYENSVAFLNAGWQANGTWSVDISYPSKILTNAIYYLSTTTSLTSYQSINPTGWAVYSNNPWTVGGAAITSPSGCVESNIYTGKSCRLTAPSTAQRMTVIYASPGTTRGTSNMFGAATSTFTIDVIRDPRCPPGSFLRSSNDSECTSCPPGTASNVTGATSCDYCLVGTYSPTSNSTVCTPCTATDLATYACPGPSVLTVGSGTATQPSVYTGGINYVQGADGRAICPAGKYRIIGRPLCENCRQGYYCAAGQSYSSQSPGVGTACTLADTPVGSYCPAGTPANAAGTGAASIPCNTTVAPPGKYCEGGQAWQSTSCPAGSRCPGGSSPPIECQAGTGSLTGSVECTPCTVVRGRYCPARSTTFTTGSPCPIGSYCTGGTAPALPCTAPAGRYCPVLSTNRAGSLCIAGSYCTGGSAGAVPCTFTTGFYCPAGTSTSTGVACPSGHTCTVSVATQCPAGSFCPNSSTKTTCTLTTTPAGRYCPAGASVSTTPCPAGHTCAGGANPAVACTAGRYCPAQAITQSVCTPFTTPAGSYCPTRAGIPNTPCPAGYTCAGGAAQPVICPAGTYCPQGASTQIPCSGTTTPAGSYCPAAAGIATTPCPGGSTCSGGSSPPVSCAAGTYCPIGSSTAISCSALTGFYCLAGVATPWQCVSAISTFAGNGTSATINGQGVSAAFHRPMGIVIDSTGNFFVTEGFGHTIRKITPSGLVSTFAGTGTAGFTNGTGTAAAFKAPEGIAIDSQNTLYVADTGNHVIRKITSDGIVTTLAGSGVADYLDETGEAASFSSPRGVAVDSTGTVYVADTGNKRIRVITPEGIVTTLAGTGGGSSFVAPINGAGNQATILPYGITVDSTNNLFVTDQNHSIRRITPQGDVSTLVGTGTAGYKDGVGTNAMLYNPYHLTIDSTGNLYVADSFNNRIRMITPNGTVSTLAGFGTFGFVDGVGISVKFNYPSSIAITSTGTMYVVDTNNFRIRMFSKVATCNTQTGL